MCRKSRPVVYKAKGFYRGQGLYRQRKQIDKVDQRESKYLTGKRFIIYRYIFPYYTTINVSYNVSQMFIKILL